MSYCTNCGNEIKENEKFCAHCGSPAPNIQPTQTTAPMAQQPFKVQPQPDTKICGKCYKRIPKDAEICPECGKKSNSPSAIVIVGGAILAVAVLFAIIPNPNKKTNSSSSVNDVVTTTAESTEAPVISSQIETQSPTNKIISDITIKSGEYGAYGKRVVLAPKTDMPDTRYVYKLPTGDYKVINGSTKTVASFAVVKDKLIPHEDDPSIDTFEFVGEQHSLASADNDMNGIAQSEYTVTLNEDEQFLIYNGSTITFIPLSGQTLEEYESLASYTGNSPSAVQSSIESYFSILYSDRPNENPFHEVRYISSENMYEVSFIIPGAKRASLSGDKTIWASYEDHLLDYGERAAYIVNRDYDIDAHVACTLLDDTSTNNYLIGTLDGYIVHNVVR